MGPEVVLILIHLTDLNRKPIDMNVHSIVSFKDVTDAKQLGEGARCAIRTLDGKAIAVRETCSDVLRLIEEKQKK